MPTNYQLGYAFENLVRECFENEGYLCMRSAGSHTPIDIAAHKNSISIFMQLKTCNSKKELIDLPKLFRSGGVQELVNLPLNVDGDCCICLILVRDMAGIKAYEYNKEHKLWYESTALKDLGIEIKRKRKEKKTDAYKVVFGNK